MWRLLRLNAPARLYEHKAHGFLVAKPTFGYSINLSRRPYMSLLLTALVALGPLYSGRQQVDLGKSCSVDH